MRHRSLIGADREIRAKAHGMVGEFGPALQQIGDAVAGAVPKSVASDGRRKSKSMRITRSSGCRARLRARFALIVLLPHPLLGEVTASLCHPACLICRSTRARRMS